MNLENIKKNLTELKESGIYDYQTKSYYSKLFIPLYDKKAIDFLRSKINKDISELYDRIEPNNRTVSKEKIARFEKCVSIFKKFDTKTKDDELFEYIKTLKDEKIDAFDIYSKIYPSIIESVRNLSSTSNVFGPINKIIKEAKFIYKQDTEIFIYGGKGENNISMKELVNLKNKINIPPKEEKKKVDKKKGKKFR